MALFAAVLVFGWSQSMRPLHDDQITIATMLLKVSDPGAFAADPLWGPDQFLPLNAIVALFALIQSVASTLEGGVVAGLVVLFAAYVWSAYASLVWLGVDRRVAVAVALLSSLALRSPGATFWGIGDATTFLSRTLYLPLVPPFVAATLRWLDDPSRRGALLLFGALGLSAVVHQVSSLYLGLALGFVTAAELTRRRLDLVVIGAASYALGVAPMALVLFVGDVPEMANVAPSVVQQIIEARYGWAFDVPGPVVLLKWLWRTPVLILPLVLGVVRRRDANVQRLAWIAVGLLISGYAIWGAQRLAYDLFGRPFSLVELWRGFRFLPFVGCVVIAQAILPAWGERIGVHRVAAVLGLIAAIAFGADVRRRVKRARPAVTCADPMYASLRGLGDGVLLAVDRDGPYRLCARTAVYATSEDGAKAFYNGPSTLLAWSERWAITKAFFDAPSESATDALIAARVTHVLTRATLEDSPRWRLVAQSPTSRVYVLNPRN